MNRTHTDAIALFTDEPGWHGRQLVRWLEARGLTVRRVSLSDCTVDLGATGHGLVVPGFAGGLPRAAFVRGIAGGSLETITLRLDILHVLEALGCPVVNGARVIERTVDKAMTSLLLRRAGVPTPRTFVSASDTAAREYVREALDAGRTLVKKPLFGSQGKGLVHVTAAAQLGSLLPGEVAYLQDFVACDGPGYRDYRVVVVGGRAVAAMERRSAHWVTNRAQGARCHGLRLDDVPRPWPVPPPRRSTHAMPASICCGQWTELVGDRGQRHPRLAGPAARHRHGHHGLARGGAAAANGRRTGGSVVRGGDRGQFI